MPAILNRINAFTLLPIYFYPQITQIWADNFVSTSGDAPAIGSAVGRWRTVPLYSRFGEARRDPSSYSVMVDKEVVVKLPDPPD